MLLFLIKTHAKIDPSRSVVTMNMDVSAIHTVGGSLLSPLLDWADEFTSSKRATDGKQILAISELSKMQLI